METLFLDFQMEQELPAEMLKIWWIKFEAVGQIQGTAEPQEQAEPIKPPLSCYGSAKLLTQMSPDLWKQWMWWGGVSGGV